MGVSPFGALTHGHVSPHSFAHIGRDEIQYGLRNIPSTHQPYEISTLAAYRAGERVQHGHRWRVHDLSLEFLQHFIGSLYSADQSRDYDGIAICQSCREFRTDGQCSIAGSIQSMPIRIDDAGGLANLAGDQRQLFIRNPTDVDFDVQHLVR